ncbi:MAG: hypothetical protein Kow0032_23380 [Methyloligellaceae bacterium]
MGCPKRWLTWIFMGAFLAFCSGGGAGPASAQRGKGSTQVRAAVTETQRLADGYRSRPAPAARARAATDIEAVAFDNFVPSIPPPGNLRPVLRAFAEGIAKHDWHGLLAFFDHNHLSAQLSLYLHDRQAQNWLGAEGRRNVDSVVRLYLYETMQLSLRDGTRSGITRADMGRIRSISYQDLNERDGVWILSFVIELDDGRKTRGELMILQNNLKFTGPVG